MSEEKAREMKGEKMITSEGALHQVLKERICEACDGVLWMDESGCYEICEAFQIALLMCELGMEEEWNWLWPARAPDETAMLEELRAIKKARDRGRVPVALPV